MQRKRTIEMLSYTQHLDPYCPNLRVLLQPLAFLSTSYTPTSPFPPHWEGAVLTAGHRSAWPHVQIPSPTLPPDGEHTFPMIELQLTISYLDYRHVFAMPIDAR